MEWWPGKKMPISFLLVDFEILHSKHDLIKKSEEISFTKSAILIIGTCHILDSWFFNPKLVNCVPYFSTWFVIQRCLYYRKTRKFGPIILSLWSRAISNQEGMRHGKSGLEKVYLLKIDPIFVGSPPSFHF